MQGGQPSISGDLTAVKIIAKLENNSELSAQITLGIAMPNGSNIESVIRQITELGVRQIVPLFSDRTILKPDNQIGNQTCDRWQRIAEEAAELSMRTYVPETNNPTSLTSWFEHLANAPLPVLKYICVISPHVTHLLTSLQGSSYSSDFVENNGQIIMATDCEGAGLPEKKKWRSHRVLSLCH